jgi:arylsulfatase A-like enzyme
MKRASILLSLGLLLVGSRIEAAENANEGHHLLAQRIARQIVEAGPTKGKRPNILLILVDDLGWADVKCYNEHTTYETPNVDHLAARGMLFTDFYSAGPVCSPTRASILTGKYPARLHITRHLLTPAMDPSHMANHLALKEHTLAEALKEGGYVTGYFGKWHLGYKNEHWASHQGFDVAKGGMDIPWAWELCYPDRTPPTKETWRKTHTRFFSPYHLTHLENGPEGEYLTERLTDETIHFVEQNKDRPFFAFLSFHTVHTPLEAKPQVVDKYRRKIQEMGLDDKKDSRSEKRYQSNPDYAAMVHHMDENVGRLVGQLDELGLANGTIIVFTSDNGGKGSVTSNLPLRGMKHNLYEGGIRVPLIVCWPGRIENGSRCARPLISNDFYPTLLELAGLPREPRQHVDAVSFKPILLGESDDIRREALYWHYPHSRNEGAVRLGDHKLIYRYRTGTAELYNLAEDIGETRDLSVDYPELTQQMTQMLRSWHQDVGAQFARGTR